MKCLVLSGSHRLQSQSEKVARHVAQQLSAIRVEADVLTLANNPIPLWDQGVWEGAAKWDEVWTPIAERLRAVDGLVVVCPEWSGMCPGGLKNFLQLCSAKEVGHKPALIVTVSSGLGGSYPVAELRMNTGKNSRICYIPDHVIVRHVEEVMNEDVPAGDDDVRIRDRIQYSVAVLERYMAGLKLVRESGVVDLKKHPNGM